MNEVNTATELLKKVFTVSKGRLITHTNTEYDAGLREIGAYLYDITFLGTNPDTVIKEFLTNPIGFNKEQMAGLISVDVLGNKIKEKDMIP